MSVLLSSLISPAVDGIVDLVKQYIPSPAEQAKFQREVESKMQDALSKSLEFQAQITLEEARSESLFKSGWRPLLGWGASIALLWSVVAAPTVAWILNMIGHTDVGLPQIPSDMVLNLVLTLLGVAGMRSYEKAKGIAGGQPAKKISAGSVKDLF